ncbi:MAG: cyanophycin synthetase, partial [Pseudomonadota bacterium]
DGDYAPQMISNARALGVKVVTFGRRANADVRLIDAIPRPTGGSLVTAQLGPGHGNARICFTVAEPGEHWISNALGVIAAVRAAGGDLGAAGLALAEMGGLKGRGARHNVNVPGGTALLIDESYNANPASMRATLKALGQTPAHRRIAVLATMGELGEFAERFHEQLADPIIEAEVDHAILVGEGMDRLASELERKRAGSGGFVPSYEHCRDAEEAIARLGEFEMTSGDVVLVKGSNFMGLGKLVSHYTSASK